MERDVPEAESDSGDGGDCAAAATSGLLPARAQRHDVRPLGAGGLEDAVAQRRRRRVGRSRERELGGNRAEAGDRLPAALARREVLLERVQLGGLEGVQRVGGAQVVDCLFHESSSVGWSSSSRSRESPVNILLLMVPSGSPSRSANSDWVKPP